MRYKIILSYDGSAFCGWQRQPSAPSVQKSLEQALEKFLPCAPEITGAGRTDTSVNAIGYTAHLDLAAGSIADCSDLCHKLNAILPREIVVHSIFPVDDGFHARFGASKRKYTYFLHRKKDPFVQKYSFLCGYPTLDFNAMNRAAALLGGTHDFSCFEKTGADNKTSVCTVYEAVWEQYEPTVGAWRGEDGVYWKFTISADRFLRNMVRAVVGTLIEVGRGKRTPESINALLEGGLRSQAGESVPGNALFLTEVLY